VTSRTFLLDAPIVIPAKAGIQLLTCKRRKLDPGFRQGDE
jgi:hypothetical protein